jgi:hypothetical protein
MQIFLPNKAGFKPEDFREVGLEDLLRDGDLLPDAYDLVRPGPAGMMGTVLCWRHASNRPGYRPECQAWQPAKPDKTRGLSAGRFYLCLDETAPETLAREKAACLDGGIPVRLADGREWTLPNGTRMPVRFALDDQGQVIRLPTRKVEKIYERTLWAYRSLETYAREGTPVPCEEALAYLAEMLSINYRVNLEICLALGLFDESNFVRAMAYTTDLPKLQMIGAETAQ